MRRLGFLAVASAAAFFSCVKEAAAPDAFPAPGTAAPVGKAISFSVEEDSKALTDPFSIASFGVYATGSVSGDEIMADQKVTRMKEGYVYSPVKYFPDEGLDFMAYAPYGTPSLCPEGGGFPVAFHFSLPESLNEDVLLAGPLRGVRADDAPVLLPFRHPLTRITVLFSLSRESAMIPSGKGIRTTYVSLSHCIREGDFDAVGDIWSSKGDFVSAARESRVSLSGERPVEACSFYSVPFSAPQGAVLHVEWEEFNLDSGAATRRFSADVDLAGRDFSVSQNITASIGATWQADTIVFEDPEAEAACVAAFDSDGDGALSYVEAESVTDLGDAFRGNGRITLFNEFVYFTGVTSIEGYFTCPFAYMASLREITLPPALRSIGGWPFAFCPSLEKISVDEANSRYYSVDGCLYDRLALAIIRVPEAFPAESFEIPSGIRIIGYGCFDSNTTLRRLRIGKDVVTIGGEALKIYNLRYITVAPGSTTFKAPPSILYAINEAGEPVSLETIPPDGSIYSLTLPSTVKSIKGFAVWKNLNLVSITLNEGLESIGMFAFNGTRLGDLVIPSTVTYIGDSAFRYTSLNSLTLLPETPPEMGKNALPVADDDQFTLYPIYVPALSFSRYSSAPVWRDYPHLLPAL